MIGIGARAWTNEFNSYVALQPFVSRPENLTHGSGPDFLKNSIVTYDPAIHAQRSAGMLGCVSFAVNNRMQSAVEYGTLRTTTAVSELRLKWDRFRAAGARRVLSFRDQTKAFLFSHWQMLVAFMLIL